MEMLSTRLVHWQNMIRDRLPVARWIATVHDLSTWPFDHCNISMQHAITIPALRQKVVNDAVMITCAYYMVEIPALAKLMAFTTSGVYHELVVF
jgi:hypothetical protein